VTLQRSSNPVAKRVLDAGFEVLNRPRELLRISRGGKFGVTARTPCNFRWARVCRTEPPEAISVYRGLVETRGLGQWAAAVRMAGFNENMSFRLA